MKSPIAAHRDRILAQKAATQAAESGETTMDGQSQYNLMLAQLAEHKRALKGIQSEEKRQGVKVDYLPEYSDYIEGALAADSGVQDDVLMYQMVWHIDCQSYATALDLLAYAVKHKLTMPQNFNRTPATLATEQIAEAALSTKDMGVELEHLQELDSIINSEDKPELSDVLDMPDQVRAKFYRAFGELMPETDKVSALALLNRAIELDEGVGCKGAANTLAKQIEAEAKQLTAAQANE